MIHEGQNSFRSQVAYVNLVAVLIISAVIIVIWNSPGVAIVFGAVGVAWVALTLRSVIEVTDDGFTVRGLLRTRRLSWSDTDAFIVVGFAGPRRPVLRTSLDYVTHNPAGPEVGLSMSAINQEAIAVRAPMFSVVAAVTSNGERIKVHGTASTPIDPRFPAEAAAELNRALEQHNPVAPATAAAAAAAA
ncbi:MAG TPA: hypothetical protein VG228_02075 [Solirubrobacteraceae bacterium]|nr:hypothetical protein [Solirubrobacteraceae bacterium]